MEQGIIPKAVLSFEIHCLEDLEDFFLVKEADQGFLGALLWDIDNPVGHLSLFRIHKTDHFSEGFECRKALIAGFCNIIPVSLQIIEEIQNHLNAKVLLSKRGDLDVMVFCGKREKELKGIPIALDGMKAGSLDVREVPVKKLVE